MHSKGLIKVAAIVPAVMLAIIACARSEDGDRMDTATEPADGPSPLTELELSAPRHHAA